MRTDRDGRTGMTKLIVAFRNVANAPRQSKVRPRAGNEGPDGSGGTTLLFL